MDPADTKSPITYIVSHRVSVKLHKNREGTYIELYRIDGQSDL